MGIHTPVLFSSKIVVNNQWNMYVKYFWNDSLLCMSCVWQMASSLNLNEIQNYDGELEERWAVGLGC